MLYSYNANGKIQIAKAPAGYRSANLAYAVRILFARVPLGIQILGVFG